MIQCDGESEIALGPSMVPKAMQIPCDEEIMPQEEAGSPPSPVTIHAALTNNDNISEGTVPSASTSDAGEEQPHNRTEATVLHYRNNSVVIIHSNGRETILTSRPWNGDCHDRFLSPRLCWGFFPRSYSRFDLYYPTVVLVNARAFLWRCASCLAYAD